MMIKKNEITNDSEWMVELEPICTEPGWRVKADNDSTIIGPPSREYINFILFNNLKSDEGEPIPPTGHTWGKTTLVKELMRVTGDIKHVLAKNVAQLWIRVYLQQNHINSVTGK